MELDKIIQHDVVKPFPLPDQCIDVVFTSPPYWGLRDYGIKSIFGGDPDCEHIWGSELPKGGRKKRLEDGDKKHSKEGIAEGFALATGGNFCKICGAWHGQLGLEPHPQMFIDHLVMICQEIKRVLKKSGSFFLNLGDTYCGSGCGTNDYRTEKSKSIQGIGKNKNLYKTGGISAKLKYDGRWIQPKQLLGIPERVMIALQDDGWILRNKNVWHKLNSMPSSVKDRLNNTWEPVFHFVKKSREYYYDLDAIREPHKATSLDRAKYDFNLIPRAWKQEVIPVSGGKNVNIDCHPAGKNPGDVVQYDGKFKDKSKHFESVSERKNYERQVLGVPHDLATSHPLGKNPGDVLTGGAILGETGAIKVPGGKGWTKKIPGGGARCAKDPRWCPPEGKNPGDVIKHDIAVGRIGNFSYNDPLHTKEYHPSGKNPGDIIQFDEEYWWNFLIGRAHSNRFYKKAYELMRNWMIKNNCFDYAIFYEWYIGEFKGKWESGTLEKGKANYLSDEKRLPFPRPETRFLGDIPGDFWSLTTQPFTGYNPDLEHFAVFPEDIVLNPLKAACPKEICKKCGKPRIRITKTDNPSKTDFDRDNLVKATEVQKTSNPQSIKSLHRNPSPDGKTKGVYYSGKTVEWSDCGCGVGFDSGVVLDPFCGRGTVGKVAKSLGLHYILFDAKPEYCELARLYIGGQKHKIPKGQSSLDVYLSSS